METRAMKRKIQKMQANPSMNPFDVPVPLVYDLISQHFSEKEVLDNLTVCKQWNGILSTSKVAMLKVPLQFNGKQKKSQRATGLIKSQRLYSDINFCTHNSEISVTEMMRLLDRFSPSLVKLKTCNAVIDDCQLPQHIFHFPILESLMLNYGPLLRMIDAKFLKKLVVNVGYQDLGLLFDFLKQQLRLNELVINGHRGHVFKQKFPVDVLFALDSFTLLNFGDAFEDEKDVLESTENFHKFLLQMSSSLRHIEITAPFSSDLKFIVNKMSLKSLLFGHGIYSFEELCLEHGLKPNTSITKLTIVGIVFPGIPKILLASLLNLEDLHVFGHLVEGDFEWIVRNVPKLKKLRLWFPCDVTYSRAYYQLLKTEDSNINQDIEIVEEV